ncbi:MAG: C25 family cysteine peptidase [Prevotellaceae bacterium]|nr:C25 family cysteine peptidase [Prevotellaceae bacterium]
MYKKISILIISILFVQNIFSQTPIQVQVEPGLTISIYSNKYIINYCSPDYTIEKDTLNGKSINQKMVDDCFGCSVLLHNTNHFFQHVEFATGEYDVIDSVGMPMLPFRSLNLQLPDDATNISVTPYNLTTQRVDFQRHYIPYLNIMSRYLNYSITLDPYYQTNGAGFYDNWYSKSDIYGFMGTKGFTFNIFPLRYNPQSKYADIIQCASFTITFNSKSNQSLLGMVSEYVSGTHYGDAMSFYDTYAGMDWKEKTSDKGNYVILTHNNYKNTLAEFITYKQSIGYNVQVYIVPNDVAANSSDIRDFIKNLYKNESTKPRFLLLVGNPSQIPYSKGTPHSASASIYKSDGKTISAEYQNNADDPPTDIYYACIEKDKISKENMTPELYIGRWSVYSEREVENIAKKTMKTEAALYNSTKAERQTIMFSGSDTQTPKTAKAFYEDLERIKNKVLVPTNIDYTLNDGRTASGSRMVNELNGIADNLGNIYEFPHFFIYNGHGNPRFIDLPWGLTHDDVDANLTNNNLPYQPFGFGFACLLNDYSFSSYNRNYTFGEGWTTYSKKGGVTFFAPTTISYMSSDKYTIRHIFSYLKDKKNYNIAQITAGGMGHYYNALINSTRKKQCERYNLLGDPSLFTYGVNTYSGSKGSFLPRKTDNAEQKGNISVFPTLAKDFIMVEATDENKITSIMLYSVNGQCVKVFNSDVLDIQNIANGLYILQIVADNQPYSFKIIINH